MLDAMDCTMATLVAPHKVDRHRELVDTEVVLVSIRHGISRHDAAVQVADELGYALSWASGRDGLYFARAVPEALPRQNPTELHGCAFDLNDAIIAVICLMLDERCEVFYSNEPELRRYVPERLLQKLLTAPTAGRKRVAALADRLSLSPMRDLTDSPTMRAMRDLTDSPTMRAIRNLTDSPTMRAMRAMRDVVDSL